ncbi:MAG: radical SAM protein [Bdellovibrio sp.]
MKLSDFQKLHSIPAPQPLLFHTQRLEVALLSDLQSPKTLRQLQSWDQLSYAGSPDQASAEIETLTLNVTQICNLACSYCAAGGDGTYGDPQKKMQTEKILLGLQAQLQHKPLSSTLKINFIGGEPLIYPEGIRQVCRYLREIRPDMKFDFWVNTNGSLLDSARLDLLWTEALGVRVSIDGPPEINDLARAQKGGGPITQKILEGLQNMLARRELLKGFKVSSVFGRWNQNAERTYDFLQQFQPDAFDFTWDLGLQEPNLLRDYLASLRRLGQRLANQGEEALLKLSVFADVFDRLDLGIPRQRHCEAGWSHAAISSGGEVASCTWWIGRPERNLGPLKTYQSPQKDVSSIEVKKCHSCWARHICGGGCAVAHSLGTQTDHEKDPLYCVHQKELIELGIELYAQLRS